MEIRLIRGGKHVESRFKRSGAMLRLVMQGADPDAYGRPFGGAGGARGQVSLDQLEKASRRQVRQEAYMEYQERAHGAQGMAELVEALTQRILKLQRRRAEGFEEGGGV